MSEPLTLRDYETLANDVAQAAQLRSSSFAYFLNHKDRLWATTDAFGLRRLDGGRLLDIGPFFSFTPFLMKRAGAGEVFVYEGDAAHDAGIEAQYAAWRIPAIYGDLQQVLGGKGAPDRLPYEDAQFDVILCWETIEHFNFNPVPFVRELRRVLKPGGRVCITVPNIAKLDKRLRLLFGRCPYPVVEELCATVGTCYHGVHWREYTLAEITRLFAAQGFRVTRACHLLTFQAREGGLGLKLKRRLIALLCAVVPSFGTLCVLEATRI
jgi:SAM-dependent methyltransferase